MAELTEVILIHMIPQTKRKFLTMQLDNLTKIDVTYSPDLSFCDDFFLEYMKALVFKWVP